MHGRLQPHVAELDYQVKCRLDAFRGLGSAIQRYVFPRGLQDSNETLFYALLTRNIDDFCLEFVQQATALILNCYNYLRLWKYDFFLTLNTYDVRKILKYLYFFMVLNCAAVAQTASSPKSSVVA